MIRFPSRPNILGNIGGTYKGRKLWNIRTGSDTNRDNILAAKSLVYRYALFAHNYCFSENSCTTSSGLGGGDNFMVTLGSWAVDPKTGHGAGNIEQQESAFMHELGHSLNLGHGGGDGTNHKPN